MTRQARLAGIFYLLTIVTGMSAALVGSRRFSDAASLVATVCYVMVTLLLYRLFAPVSRSLSLVAALFSLAGCALWMLEAFHLHPLHINGLVFFGCYCVLIAWLILKSTFAPPWLGALMAIAGLGWLTFLSPHLANHFASYTMISGLVGEGSLTVWLLAVGFDVLHWKQRS